jgi:hypothetical protein
MRLGFKKQEHHGRSRSADHGDASEATHRADSSAGRACINEILGGIWRNTVAPRLELANLSLYETFPWMLLQRKENVMLHRARH